MMTPETEKQFYVEGIRLFNAGEYFEAHEVWEDLARRVGGEAQSSTRA